MDVRSVLLARRTVHDYSEHALPEGAIERALEAAIAAPNHRMTEPWRFVLVGKQTRAGLCELSIELKAGGSEPSPELVESTSRKMLNPAELLVVTRVRAGDAETEREDYAAVACAIQNLSLSLWAEGVGSKWSTGGITRHAQSYELLGIDNVLEEIVGFVWVGIAAKTKPKVPRRRSLEELVRRLP